VSLYPTKTRLDLLQAVADGAVFRLTHLGRWCEYELDRGPGVRPRYGRVDSKVRDAFREGWVRLGDVDPNHRYRDARLIDLTDAGRAVLDAGGAS
jgi:hypothetical protein